MPRPLDLIKRVAKLDSEDPNLAPFYEDAIRDTVERFEGHRLSGHNGRRPEEVSQFRDVLCAWASEHRPGRFQNPVLRRSYAPPVAAHK